MNGGTVIVTGCSTGLGLVSAIELARRGFKVYATVKDLNERAELDDAVRDAGVALQVLELDVTDPASVERAIARVVAESDSIYALVNNAGIGLRGYFEDLSEEEIRDVFDANVFGTMRVTRAVLPYLRKQRTGRVVIISSVGGRIASFGVSAYVATKFAQEGFAEALFQEVLPFGIYVSLVEPGITKTERWGTHRNIARGAQNPNSPYYQWFTEGERLADMLVNSSPTRPEAVGLAVARAIEAPRPRLRYVVGWRANLFILMRRYLPNPWFERLWFGNAIRRSTRAGLPAEA